MKIFSQFSALWQFFTYKFNGCLRKRENIQGRKLFAEICICNCVNKKKKTRRNIFLVRKYWQRYIFLLWFIKIFFSVPCTNLKFTGVSVADTQSSSDSINDIKVGGEIHTKRSKDNGKLLGILNLVSTRYT